MADFSTTENKFYMDAKNYWAKVPPTVDGVLGGYGHINDIDIEGSKAFLKRIFETSSPPGRNYALDCGAGIGRISQNLLCKYFDKVDLVEQDERFITSAKERLRNKNQLGTIYNIGLQHFRPQRKYDVIWCQWVLGYLNDFDTIYFFQRCAHALQPNGVLVVKDNIAPNGELEYDEDDSSVTRPVELMQKLFDAAGLKVEKTDIQTGFPDEIYAVHMFALTPLCKDAQN